MKVTAAVTHIVFMNRNEGSRYRKKVRGATEEIPLTCFLTPLHPRDQPTATRLPSHSRENAGGWRASLRTGRRPGFAGSTPLFDPHQVYLQPPRRRCREDATLGAHTFSTAPRGWGNGRRRCFCRAAAEPSGCACPGGEGRPHEGGSVVGPEALRSSGVGVLGVSYARQRQGPSPHAGGRAEGHWVAHKQI